MTIPNISDFEDDAPKEATISQQELKYDGQLINGVKLLGLRGGSDQRGYLSELLTRRDAATEPIVHVYQVFAEPRSVRGWVIHKQQIDRLNFTQGNFQIALFDIRKDSDTYGVLNVFDLGKARPAQLHIPTYVVHGVCNRGIELSSFVNCPTNIYDPAHPDKFRLAYGHPGIPHRFTFD